MATELTAHKKLQNLKPPQNCFTIFKFLRVPLVVQQGAVAALRSHSEVVRSSGVAVASCCGDAENTSLCLGTCHHHVPHLVTVWISAMTGPDRHRPHYCSFGHGYNALDFG